MNILITIIILLALVLQVKGKDDFYTAGVVEFQPKVYGLSSAMLLQEHLQAYKNIINSNEAIDTDIIVFPEGTLNNDFQLTYVPNEFHEANLCDENEDRYAPFLKELSCFARQSRKYLVINLTEKEDCLSENDIRQCSNDGLNKYNTNVVFNRDGQVISRYRKTNIYDENKNTTLFPEYGTFETDFGVTFGHFICFDILFYTPAQELVNKLGIKHIIMTSMFFSELPFLTAVQLQQSWAWSNNVVLLAAGASSPENGMTGSGIYLGNQGSLVSVMATETGFRKLYVANVPKVIARTSHISLNPYFSIIEKGKHRNLKLLQDPNITDFVSIPLDFNFENVETSGEICQNAFCCNYNISTALKESYNPTAKFYKYRIGVFNGRRSYIGGRYSDIQVCALYACTSNEVQTCAEIFDSSEFENSSFLFKTLDLSTNISKTENMIIMPSSLDTELLPLGADKINWILQDSGNSYHAKLNLTSPTDHVISFGIYVKLFDAGKSAAINLSFSTIVITFLFLGMFF